MVPITDSKRALVLSGLVWLVAIAPAAGQVPPSADQIADYDGLHQAAYEGDLATIRALATRGADLEARDGFGRTPLHVAAYASRPAALRALVEAGADLGAFENQSYDVVTIASVADDLDVLDAAIALGADPGLVTSPYEGTALIAASHLGHHAVVARLVAAGAPLDHVNNLDWTALLEAVILGDGGPDHVETVRILVEAGADRTIADRAGMTPLDHARARGYDRIIALLE